MSLTFYCVIYSDTSSTNISKQNIFDTDDFANLNVGIAEKYVRGVPFDS